MLSREKPRAENCRMQVSFDVSKGRRNVRTWGDKAGSRALPLTVLCQSASGSANPLGGPNPCGGTGLIGLVGAAPRLPSANRGPRTHPRFPREDMPSAVSPSVQWSPLTKSCSVPGEGTTGPKSEDTELTADVAIGKGDGGRSAFSRAAARSELWDLRLRRCGDEGEGGTNSVRMSVGLDGSGMLGGGPGDGGMGKLNDRREGVGEDGRGTICAE